jgi:hypothetical protein
MPGVEEWVEAERICVVRLPANQVLQNRIGYLLKRPVGRPPKKVRRSYASFTYRLDQASRVIAKVEWHPGDLYPPGRVHRDQHEPPGRAGRPWGSDCRRPSTNTNSPSEKPGKSLRCASNPAFPGGIPDQAGGGTMRAQ